MRVNQKKNTFFLRYYCLKWVVNHDSGLFPNDNKRIKIFTRARYFI